MNARRQLKKRSWRQAAPPRRALLVVAGLLAIALAAPAGASAAVTGAAFTTVNEGIDGTGHCKNGNPAVNCNIYDGKEYVWLNGGPSVAYLGDGSYFFAVLDPGGQKDPNDGSEGNLSLPSDTHFDRTFTVENGGVKYGGEHDFDSNKIRLMPYEDTSNPGGVYILAICSLEKGYPVTASSCKYDAFKVQELEGTPVTKGLPLTITKGAEGAFKNTFKWEIEKSVDKTLVKQIGGTATFKYTVKVTHDAGSIGAIKVTGTISVFNPNTDENSNTLGAEVEAVTDELSNGTKCTVTNGGAQALSEFETPFGYECELSDLPEGQLDNLATVKWPPQFLSNGVLLEEGSAEFTFHNILFSEEKIDNCASVTDTLAGKLGEVCVGEENPKSFEYSNVVNVPQFNCTTVNNTAKFTTNTTGTEGEASKSVKVCGPGRSGALTIGFWKNTNGNGLIGSYCKPSGKTSLSAYLAGLGGGKGPFADAAGKSCSELVKYVNGILQGATATNMNVMLKAQMLATALDVYFSDPNLGWTSTAAGKVKQPSNFFTGTKPLGSFLMDLTAICPMVDNTTAGTATCQNNTPSSNGFASGAFPSESLSVQGILTYEATTPSPFNGLTGANSVWYAGNRTQETLAKNAFDQINNQDAFAA